MNGICCPFCGSENNQVVNTVKIDNGVRRRRGCLDCRMRWNTFEYPEDAEQSLRERQIHLIHATVDAQYAIKEAIEKLQQIKI